MQIDRYISQRRIIDLKSKNFQDSVAELLNLCQFNDKKLRKDKILNDIVSQEQTISTYLGHGVCLPHARIPLNKPYIFAIGRCPEGFNSSDQTSKKTIKLVFLLLASETEHSYLNVLAHLAKILQNANFWEDHWESPITEFRKQLMLAFGKASSKPSTSIVRFNRSILKKIAQIAKDVQCNSVLVFADVFQDPLVELGRAFSKFKIIFITQKTSEVSQKANVYSVPVRLFSKNRFSQLKTAVIIALTHGIISQNDRLCCISGLANSSKFDAFMILDVSKEIQSVFGNYNEILPACVKPDVFERLLTIAMELAVEGREGSPIGSLFVLGNVEELRAYSKPLVLNPFFGYKREDKNILNPFMAETIKEFASIDGAFVIDGEGVLESAGTMICVSNEVLNKSNVQLPGGLGTRHTSAAAISLAADCISIAISSSTGQVTLFRKGNMLPLFEKVLE